MSRTFHHVFRRSFAIKALVISGIGWAVGIAAAAPACGAVKAYYTRLPYEDHGMTGKYADIVVELPQGGRLVFGREFGYQPRWEAPGRDPESLPRLIPRQGDGPDHRPDNHNIACNAAIVARTATRVTVHWRYAPDITKLSFTDFRAAYNEVGNPAPFYADYADETFTIHADGRVERIVKNGCERLDDWNDPENQIEQTLHLTPGGVRVANTKPARLSQTPAAPVGGPPLVNPARTEGLVAHWSFDEGVGRATVERRSGKPSGIGGAAVHWRPGVSGSCLSFDSYSSVVSLPAADSPALKDAFTLSAWVAVQEIPFHLAAIVERMKDQSGYLLGLNGKGQVELRLGDGAESHTLATDPLPLYEWVHVAAVARQGGPATIFLNGQPVATSEGAVSWKDPDGADIGIGMTRSLRQHPLHAERGVTRRFQTTMVFSGRIDEVMLFDVALADADVAVAHAALKPTGPRPLDPWVLPAGPENPDGFGARCLTLAYSPEWDGLWRVGDHADILVTFADKPWRFVFWRGTRYLPSLVTAHGRSGIWSNDQGAERFTGECFEHMSDMLCRYSNARVIHASDARVMVHWRNASTNIQYRWPALDANGWGIWSDEYWTIYPDGTSIRHQLVRNHTKADIDQELNQNEILTHPGQVTEDVLHDDGIIVVNLDGRTHTVNRNDPEWVVSEGNWNTQVVNLKGRTRQFEIGEIGAWSRTLLHRPVYWRGWNHYPVQLIPSDGTRAITPDRPASMCPATFCELRHMDGNHIEAMVMYGLTDGEPAALAPLNRSWNFAPDVVDPAGCTFDRYEKRERAYRFTRTQGPLAFTLRTSGERPLVNPAFVIANWGEDGPQVALKLNGKPLAAGREFRSGIEIEPDGSRSLVLWIPMETREIQESYRFDLVPVKSLEIRDPSSPVDGM